MMDIEIQSPGAAHWSRQQYECLFSTSGSQGPSERLAWVVENDSQKQPDEVPDGKSELLGFLVARRIDKEWELENIVVAETVRRRGIGTLLLAELIAHARAERGSSILLEVRDSNQRARELYRRMGFEETGSRKSYYAGPAEDAILWRLCLY